MTLQQLYLKVVSESYKSFLLDCHATAYKLPDDPNMTTWGGGGGGC